MGAEGDLVGSAHVDIHVNAGPGEAELAAFRAKVDRDFEELGRKKAEASLNLKKADFDKQIDEAKAQLDYFKRRRASATLDLAKSHFDEQIAAAEAELKALTAKKRTIQVDSQQVRAAHNAERLLTKERELGERAAIRQATAERRATDERSKAISGAIKARAEIARLSDQYEKLRGRQIGLEKSSRNIFSPRSIGQAESEARRLERVASEADHVKHKIEQLGGSVDHLDPQIGRNTSMLDRWLSRLGDTSVRIGPITTSIKGLATGLGLLGPLVFELGGGATALVGTLGEGLAGAAVVSAGALAGFVTSALGVGMVLKPMIGEFGEVHKAMEKVTKDQRKYGKGSEQAKTAQEQLTNTLKGVSPVARKSFKDYVKLKSAFEEKTAPAKAALFSGFEASLKTAKALLPEFASETVKTSQVASKAWSGWMKSLRSSEAKHLLGEVMSNFRASIPGVADGLGSLVAIFGRLAAAGSHFLPGLSNGFAAWANNLERAVGGGQQLQQDVGGMVNQMRDLGHLTQDTGSLLVHIFDASASSGNGLVKSLDSVIKRWDKWTQTASGKAGLKEFFSQSKTATEDFFSSLGHLTKLLFEFSRATAPVANGLLHIVTWIGDIVSAADELVGVKQIFQGIGLVLAGLFVASKVLAFKDAVSGVIARLGALTASTGAAAAATEAEAAAAADAAVAIEAEAVASAEAATAAEALGVSAAAGGAAMEGTAASAGILGAAMAPEILVPAGIAAGLIFLGSTLGDTETAFEKAAAKFRSTAHEIPDALKESVSATDKYVTAQRRNRSATEEVAAARKHLTKLQSENAPLQDLTKAINKLNDAEAHQSAQATVTGRVNKQQIVAQKELLKGAKARVRAAENEIEVAKKEARMPAGIAKGMAVPKSAKEQADIAKSLAKGERDLASATREVAQARKEDSLAAIPYERNVKHLKPLSDEATQGLRKLYDTIGAGATKKIGSFVNPNDVQKVTDLGNRLTKLGRGGQVKQIAVKSQGADQTIAKLQRLQRQTTKVESARANIKVGANDAQAQSKLKRLSALSQKVTGSRNTINILANATSAENAIHRLQSHLRQVAAQKYQATMSAVDKTQPGWEAAYHHLRETASKKYEARINAVDNASGKAKDAEGNAKRAAKQYKLSITATNSQALSAISAVQSSLATLHDKTVNVNVVTHKSGGFSGGPAGMYYSTFAQGGITDRELQRANERAVMRQSGPSRKITRPTMLVGEQAPNHPEYVIATNPAFKADNERYLEDAAGEFGKEVVPAYAKGKGGGKKKKGGSYSNDNRAETLAHHPPKPKHRPHKIAKVEKWGPVAAYNQAEIDAGIREENYQRVYDHDESEIKAGRMSQWEFAKMRSILSGEVADYRHLMDLVPDIRSTVDKELGRIHRMVDGKGEYSKHAIGNLNHQVSQDKAKLSKMKKGKNESDASFRKRKRPLEHSITTLETQQHKAEKERERLLEIRTEAKQELSEVTGARKMNETKSNAERAEDELGYVEDVETGVVEAPYAEAEAGGESPEMEGAKAELIRAEVAGNTAAEEAARKHMVEIAEREYNAALATPGVQDDIEKGEQLKQLREEASSNGGRGTIGEQTASYNEAREQLYREFASNITPTAAPGVSPVGASGGPPTYTPGAMSKLAAATPVLHGGHLSGAQGGSKIEVVNNFAAPPPDPLTWTRQQAFELENI